MNDNPVEPAAPTMETVAPTPEPSGKPAENPDPMARPMEKVEPPAVEAPKKKKIGLIIGLIIGLVVLIGGGVAIALVLANSQKTDAVSSAIAKIMEGKASDKMMVNGTFDVAIKNKEIPFENIKIDLKSQGIMSSLINSSSAVLTATLRDGDDIKINFDEVYATDSNLYFKIDGIESTIKDLMTVNGILNTDEDDTTLGTIAGALKSVKALDGQWLKISVDEINAMTKNNAEQSQLSCLTDLVGNVGGSTNTLAETYRKNQFIGSTNKDLAIASKNDPVYLVVFDEENLRGFLNETKDSAMVEQMLNCMGTSDAQIDVDSVVKAVKQIPDLYVEVDGDSNFTRVYFVTEVNNGEIKITTDLSFSYPTNVNVPEPLEYKNFSEVITELIKTMYVTEN